VALDGAVSRRTHVYNEEFSFRRVVQAVELLKRRKEQGSYRHPLIQAKFIVTEETVDELDALRAWAFNLGVEHVKVKRKFRMMPGRLERGKIYSLPQLETIHQHAVVRSTEELDFTPLGCSHPWDSVFLAGDGQFGLCSWDPRDVVKLGPAHADFARLWNGEALRQVRRWHTGQGAVGDPCRKCNRLPGHLWQGAAHAVPG
jgi:hypothetical protein